MSTLVHAQNRADILASLRRLKGPATVGDVVADSGLPSDEVRAGLKSLLETHRGHLSVTDSGELVYDFDPKLILRGSEPFLARVVSGAKRFLTQGFKAWIVVMLVGYFVVFVALVIAAIFASQRGGSGGRSGGWGRSSRGMSLDFPLWYWVWGPRWRIGRPYYGHRWERTLERDDRVPFYKKVFAFVFGPDKPRPTQRQLDRAKLRLIRAKHGVVSTAELVEHTGSSFDDAEEEMGRLLGAYDGEAAATPNGELVYAFPEVMTSTEGRLPRAPNPAWMRLEHPEDLTGNTTGANAAIVGMNAFTLLASATAPWFIFPRLGMGGTSALIALVLVPVVFSVLFFAGPLTRMVGVKRENRRREKRNVRKVLLGLIYERALEGGAPISVDDALVFVSSRLKKQDVDWFTVERTLHEIAAELDADVTPNETGHIEFSFPGIGEQYRASAGLREALGLDRKRLGPIVFATSDDPEEAVERDKELFDRALEAGASARLQPLDSHRQISYEDDYDLVAFDEELARRD